MNAFRGASLKEKCSGLEGAEEILVKLKSSITQFVYTHKGLQCPSNFTRLWVFMIILQKSSQQPTALSASPTQEGVDYLLAKYGLDKKKTYHIGDRP